MRKSKADFLKSERNIKMTVHCLFEQSGTFKNEFLKKGITAYDYDVLNDFDETDFIIDLFSEILTAYEKRPSIFDTFKKDDMVIAFFPCVRFEEQILLSFRGDNFGFKEWSLAQKLEYNLKLHSELAENYNLITKLVLVAIDKGFKLIIENPYAPGGRHYLNRYWCLKPSIIDCDRSRMGDYYKKPTQYWFINFEPKQNYFKHAIYNGKTKSIENERNKVKRSLISPEYAKNFIEKYILD